MALETPSLRDEPRRHPLAWAAALFFLFLSVPFYYLTDREPTLILGLPDWCWITVFADLCFAATVAGLILRTWREDSGRTGSDHDGSAGS